MEVKAFTLVCWWQCRWTPSFSFMHCMNFSIKTLTKSMSRGLNGTRDEGDVSCDVIQAEGAMQTTQNGECLLALRKMIQRK
jgi:hypothetical protein